MKKIMVIFLMIFIVACSRPHSPINIDDSVEFEGLQNLNSTNQIITVLMVHGMCDNSYSWADSHAKKFANYLSIKKEPTRSTLLYYFPNGNDNLGSPALSLYDYDSLKVYTFHYSNWNEIRFSGALERNDSSANLNNTIKNKLVNDCLSDVTTYAGKKGIDIRISLLESMALISDRISDYKNERIFIVSESLGSKVIADTLIMTDLGFLQTDLNSDENFRVKQQNKAQLLVKNTTAVFMVSNQLALLYPLFSPIEDGDKNSGRSMPINSLPQAIEMIMLGDDIKSDTRDYKKLSIVAFSDPNDILSYPIPEDNGDQSNLPFKIFNLDVSNAITWFGFLADPVKTHTGYLENDDVLEVITCGSKDC